MKFRIHLHGKLLELEAALRGDRVEVAVEGRKLEARILQSDGLGVLLERDGLRIRVLGEIERSSRHLWIDGRTLGYEIRAASQRSALDEQAGLVALIPAIVKGIHVAAGQKVRRGDRLVTLESMKMVMTIEAPEDGTVLAVRCQPGQAVEAGVPLIELESSRSDVPSGPQQSS